MQQSFLRRVLITAGFATAFAASAALAATPEESAARLEALGVTAANKKPTAATLGDITMISLYGDRAKGLTDADCALFATLPKLQQVMISGGRLTKGCLDALSQSTNLGSINLSTGDIDPGALAVLARTATLESVLLSDLRGLAAADVGALAALPKLRFFTLAYTMVPVGRTTWFDDRTLVEIGRLAKVQTMTLSRVSATAKGMAAIAAMPALRELTLDRGNFGEDALEPLAKSQITSLNLSQNHRIGARAPELVARIASLQRLDLSNTSVGGNLAPLAGLARLTALEVSHTFVGKDDLAALAKAPALQQLAMHDATGVDDAGLTALAESKTLSSVGLGRTTIGDAGVAALLAMPTMRSIYADDEALSDAFTAAAAKSKIINLQASNSDIGDAGLAALAEVASLTTVSLRNTRITEAGIAAAKAKRPTFNIYK